MKRFLGIGLLAILALALVACPGPTSPATKSSEAKLTAFGFRATHNATQLSADIDSTKSAFDNTWNTPALPAGVNTAILVPDFAISASAKAYVNDAQITSGVTEVDFSSGSVVITVIAEDGVTESTHTVNVSAPALGFSSFQIDVVGMPGGKMALTVDNDAHTITGEIPYTYRDAINESGEASLVTFTANAGATVFEGAAQIVSGTSTLDFSPSGTSVHTITLSNADLIEVDYTVTVTAASTASSDADLSAFSVTLNSVTYTGTIDGAEVTLPRLPPTANLTALLANFTMHHVSGTLADGATALTSGTSTLDLTADKILTATAEDGTTTKAYTIKAADNKPAMAIVAFDVDAATDGMKYVDVKIIDKAAIANGRVGLLYNKYDNSFISNLATDGVSFSNLAFWGSVTDGDIIRIWDADSSAATITTDTAKADNTKDRWDFVNLAGGGTQFLSTSYYDVLYVYDGAAIINVAPFAFASNNRWLLIDNPLLPALTSACAAGYWSPDAAISWVSGATVAQNAVSILVTSSAGNHARLVAGKTFGVSKADWEFVAHGTLAFSNPTATATINTNIGGTATVSVDVVGTAATPDKVVANLSLIGGPVAALMTKTVNTWSVSESIGASELAAGTYAVPIIAWDTATGTINRTSINVTILPPKAVAVDTATIAPAMIPANATTSITITAMVSAQNGAAVNAVSADLSPIGGSASVALAQVGATSTWTATLDVTPGNLNSTFAIPVTAEDTVNVCEATRNASLDVSNAPAIMVSNCQISSAQGIAGAANSITISADVVGINGASVSAVSADLSAFVGGTAATAMTLDTGSTYKVTFVTDVTQAAGSYTINILATDGAPTPITDTGSVNYALVQPAFLHSDMEANMHSLGKGIIPGYEVRTITVSAACTSDGDITITLNGVATTIAVLTGDTIAQVQDKIVATAFSEFFVEKDATTAGKIWFGAKTNGVKGGAYSFSGGTTGVAISGGATIGTSSTGADNTSGYESATNHAGVSSQMLHVKGSVTGTIFIFTSAVTLNPQAGATKITFWVKGSTSNSVTPASVKTLSIQVGSVGSSVPGQLFPCGNIGSTDKTVVSAGSHSYTGTFDTAGNWIKITLDLITGTATTTAGNTISFKLGGAANMVCDFWIDDIIYE